VNVRAPSWDDLPEVAQLVADCDRADTGRVDMTLDDIRRDWSNPDVDLARDAWLIELDGELAGHGWLWAQAAGRPKSVGFVRPAARGRGVGSELLRRIESRAGELDAELVASYVVTEVAGRLLEKRGFRVAGHFYRMAIELEAPPAPSKLPPDIAVAAFVPGRDDRALHAAVLEAFANEPDFEPEPFERWRERHVVDPSLVPDLWLVARDGDDIAGFALTALSSEGGFLDELGVRAPWRRRGLGYALLTRSFAAAHAHGARRVALGVAADNPTGAVQLYERAGMHIAFHVDRYEKRLR
jgi:mycothiol synthase